MIWATRLAYAHSDGTGKVQYQLGGVDNWVSPKIDNGANSTGNYGFVALATTLRGFKQGAFKGNNFSVLSTEVRVPIVSTFVKRPVQAPMLKNLQLVLFADAGSAWQGFFPSGENLSTTYQFPQYALPGSTNNVFLTVTVPNKAQLGIGAGAGLRTMLFGYFVRFDYAISSEGKSMYYLGLGTDF